MKKRIRNKLEKQRLNEAPQMYSKSYTNEELFKILEATENLSKFCEENTVLGRFSLKSSVKLYPEVKKALIYIIENYKKQRKNNPDKFGYMHCIETASLLAEHWFYEPDQIAAALLHDVREDIPNGEQYLKSNYNQHIVHLVKELTEKDKSWDTIEQEKATWKERKLEEMKKISHFTPETLALKLWDQISNIAETINDLEKLSPEDRQKYREWFNADYDMQIWKYSTLSDIIQKRIQICKEEQLFQNDNEEKNLQKFANSFQWLVNTLKSLMDF